MARTPDKSSLPTKALARSPSGETCETLVAPRSNRTVRLNLSLGQERLEIVGPQGATELSVILTETGPKLIFESADVQIVTPKKIALDCQRFEVRAQEEIQLSGATTSIQARKGDVRIDANDKVSLVGEQIRLNCDGPDEVPQWMQRELAAHLLSAAMPSLVPRRDRTGDLNETPSDSTAPPKRDEDGD
jgi:hypothetical protein